MKEQPLKDPAFRPPFMLSARRIQKVADASGKPVFSDVRVPIRKVTDLLHFSMAVRKGELIVDIGIAIQLFMVLAQHLEMIDADTD